MANFSGLKADIQVTVEGAGTIRLLVTGTCSGVDSYEKLGAYIGDQCTATLAGLGSAPLVDSLNRAKVELKALEDKIAKAKIEAAPKPKPVPAPVADEEPKPRRQRRSKSED